MLSGVAFASAIASEMTARAVRPNFASTIMGALPDDYSCHGSNPSPVRSQETMQSTMRAARCMSGSIIAPATIHPAPRDDAQGGGGGERASADLRRGVCEDFQVFTMRDA